MRRPVEIPPALARAIEAAHEEGLRRWGDAQWAKRVDLAACYRLVDHFDMCDLVANHITARVPGAEGEFLINPFGMMYEEITASSLIRIDLKGRVIENPNDDYSVNRAGFIVHSAVHGARADVDCVIHTHTVAGVAVSALAEGILPISQSAMRFSTIGYHDFEGVAVERGERERLAAALGNGDALVLRNHGLLVAGASIAEAFNTMYRLERVCRIQCAALASGRPLAEVPPAIVEKANAQYANNRSQVGREATPLGVLEWPAMRRLLDRRDPSYRL